MAIDLNKGATVGLVKALSDDIRTLPDGTKAANAGAALRGNTSGTVLRTYLTHNEIEEVLTD